ncbi:ABC transporter ATP-binding protein [Pseudogemmobacter humi]|uniref:Spermidine/putrescine import ATP-binding protein PotA n=1 Tax=Pseudogemmobacter humi TaxID=2483812 RepID=A0A3P5XIV2_9RHOB|nr:ABC transporter ATP-binding protein [Pseudogemmobacter humi]VDC28672.1 Spermidine/putrescine import ATP-binding protein PotA [Pseudogemmobacter humi]
MTFLTQPVRETDIVTMRNLDKSFGTFVALRDINLEIRKGEILTFLGPSGCGKSTLMRIIAGFEAPSRGELLLHDQDMTRLPPERRPVNMVFQRYALFPHLDVFDNIAFGLRIRKLPESEVRTRVMRMMELVQLDKMASRWINELSGGQSQRVALARALVNGPEVLLLDEPLAALDLKIRQLMLQELRRIQESTGTTFVYVTHDQDEAMILSSRVVLMDHGRIEQVGTPDELYFRPRSLFVARFLGEMNILPARIVEASDSGVVARFEGGTARSATAQPGYAREDGTHIAVRPEAIRIAPAPENAPVGHNACLARIAAIEPIGGRVVYSAELPNGTRLRAQRIRDGGGADFSIGQPVLLSWEPNAMTILRD